MPRHVALQPAANPQARQHYRDTIESAVPLSRIRPHVEDDVFSQLEELYPSGEAWLWGATPGSESQMERMEVGDLVLFYRDRTFFSQTRVTLIDMNNEALALDLWKRNQGGHPFLHIFFLEEAEPVDIDYHDVWEVAQFGPEDRLWGLTVLPEKESSQVLEEFDFGVSNGTDPVQEEAAGAAEGALESGQGFSNSAAVRQALEDHSMDRAKQYFERKGFKWKDVSGNHPYDLRCERGDITIHVEVKGTRRRVRRSSSPATRLTSPVSMRIGWSSSSCTRSK